MESKISKVKTIEIPNEIDKDTFMKKVSVNNQNKCWEWVGVISTGGYGVFSFKGKSYRSHRVSYFLHKGIIPKGLVIDHVCRNRKCCNPTHLRAVDSKTNSIENSIGACAINKNKTHCKRGHRLSGENIIIKKKGRMCRECNKIYVRMAHLKRPVNKRRKTTKTEQEIKEQLRNMIL